jgi:hypothetical protein
MMTKLTNYFPLIVTVILLFFSLIYANWKNWRSYYSTILFVICVDFFISIVTFEHSLWHFNKALLIPNHTIADFVIAFTNLPLITIVFLSRYPYKTQLYKQIAYIFFWTILFTGVETIFLFLKLISYHNGWNFWWSLVVWFFIFLAIIIHHIKPYIAWLLCFTCSIFLILYFQIPVFKMK